MLNLLRLEAHHATTCSIQRKQVVCRNEFAQPASGPLHGSVLVEPVSRVHNPEARFYQFRDEHELSIQLPVFQES